MDSFEDIRPYRDDEVAAVLARLVRDTDIQMAVARFVAPFWSRLCAPLVRHQVRRALLARTRHVASVRDFQRLLEDYFARLVQHTTAGFTVSGVDRLERGRAHLFIANHRDIALDSGFMNYALWLNGFPTTRIAVGDNLLEANHAADLMRLNKSFVVQRKAKGAKAAFAALSLTSSYIRHSLETGESVWIAQREGRAKDGCDRTEPAVLKMLSLAHRDAADALVALTERCAVVPVSISYELDPCDLAKARELRIREETGEYHKAPGEDLASIVTGITGFKGRVHLAFGRRISARFSDAEQLAAAIDREVAAHFRLFPTHLDAASRLGLDITGLPHPEALARVQRAFARRLEECPERDRPYLLRQYANPARNRREIGSCGSAERAVDSVQRGSE